MQIHSLKKEITRQTIFIQLFDNKVAINFGCIKEDDIRALEEFNAAGRIYAFTVQGNLLYLEEYFEVFTRYQFFIKHIVRSSSRSWLCLIETFSGFKGYVFDDGSNDDITNFLFNY